MAGAGDSRSSGSARNSGRTRYTLPSNLPDSLRHLDDFQLDELLRAVVKEAGRRGRPLGGEHAPPPASAPKKPAAATAVAKTRRRPVPLAPGQARLVRAAFEAGVKPAAIARELRLSRAQVEQVLGGHKQRER